MKYIAIRRSPEKEKFSRAGEPMTTGNGYPVRADGLTKKQVAV
jgi:hypothetical protein